MIAVLFLDLDDFKTINDSLGHAAGDEVLTGAGDALDGARWAPADTVSRLGGDEFGVLLTGASALEPPVGGRKTHCPSSVSRSPWMAVSVTPEVSIGVAIRLSLGGHGPQRRRPPNSHRLEADDLLRDADVAMYRAKASGKGCSRSCSSRGCIRRRWSVWTWRWRSARRSKTQAFRVRVPAGREPCPPPARRVGTEALLRWDHPVLGPMSRRRPFVPLAEETGLIPGPSARWVLREACRQRGARCARPARSARTSSSA